MQSVEEIEQRIVNARRTFDGLRAEMARMIVGHEELIEQVFIALVCGGHCLLEGVPGLGKTLMVRSLGETLSLSFSRIQFTPDLMPADITGTNMLTDDPSGRKIFEFQRGPLFAHIVLADEINRATPKTQSALLEAMQEQSVTVGGKMHRLENPFMVLATQNPIEMEGTYPLPEAQVDRFFFKLLLQFPSRAELARIADLTTAAPPSALREVLDAAGILEMRQWVREVPLADVVKDYAVRLVLSTHPQQKQANGVGWLSTALRHVRLEPARFAELDSGGERARATSRPAQCFFRRYSQPVAAEPASPLDSQPRSRRRRRQRGENLERSGGASPGSGIEYDEFRVSGFEFRI